MKAVSNASPLIILGKLGQLGLLLKVFDQVLIPREVYNEVVINGLQRRDGPTPMPAPSVLIRHAKRHAMKVVISAKGFLAIAGTWASSAG